MTLSEWIENYCEENELELPDGVPNEKVALDFIIANKAGGVQPEGTINITENGNNIDVAQYAFANVLVQSGEFEKILETIVTPNTTSTSEETLTTITDIKPNVSAKSLYIIYIKKKDTTASAGEMIASLACCVTGNVASATNFGRALLIKNLESSPLSQTGTYGIYPDLLTTSSGLRLRTKCYTQITSITGDYVVKVFKKDLSSYF